MSIPTTRQSAKALVEKISKEHGHPSEAQWAMLTPENRREWEQILFQKDSMIGSSVITLAKNLYTSKARFVFELLQNADDNNYSEATSPPYVAFHVYSNRIVLECNENGFNDKNLKAICAVGQSSKTGNQGYIGEKGIGFKSVFMVAWKVHIQSGAFSFSFIHRKGDSGMGMISPQWEDTSDENSVVPLTRITLHLHDTGDEGDLAKMQQTIKTQFQELQEAILLFMKNLTKIHIAFYDREDKMTTSTTFTKSHLPSSLHATLTKSTTADGNTNEEVKHFHVTTHEVTNLSKNDNRTYSEREEATRAYARSKVTLAFPLTAESDPIISPQELFVFLPLRRVGFNFLIQADFVTDASRQDIVVDSRRNLDLLDGIADAFIKAILQFLEHERSSLRYHWVRYLPDKSAPNVGSFWVSLIKRIASRLMDAKVLFGRKEVNRYGIKSLRRLTQDALDEKGEPLFDDGDPEQIISPRYTKEDQSLLSSYGLRKVELQTFLSWLKKDLTQGARSRMRSPETSDDWHTRVAKVLQRIFILHWDTTMAELKLLHLLPTQDGTWTSAWSNNVYFAQCRGMDIPSGLDIHLIPRSIKNKERLLLFKYLGVKEASVSFIRTLIIKKAPERGFASPWHIQLSASKHRLEFLYLTEHLKNDTEPPYDFLIITTATGHEISPATRNIYIKTDEPYGPWDLSRPTEPGPNPGDGAPGFSADFVHEEYFKGDIPAPPSQNITWSEWLHQKLGVQKDLPALHTAELDPVSTYIQTSRPERFLGFLRLRSDKLKPGSKLVDALQETEVLCRGGRQHKLKYTYFPTQELERRVGRFVEPDASFPWLWLESESTSDGIPAGWKPLLTVLACGIPFTDLDFALDMLNYSIDTLSNNVSLSSRSRLFALYEHIQTKYRESEDRPQAQEKILEFFSKKKCIYIPLDGDNCSWAFPTECVWNAPQGLISKHALKYLYEPILASDSANWSYFEQFFSTTLKIADCTWETYLQELRALKADDCDDADMISGIYNALDVLRPNIALNKDEVTAAFEEDALIYLETDDGPAWHKTSACVWSRAATLRGRVSLNEEYEKLEALFVDFLGVKPVDLAMAIDELKEAGQGQATTVENLVESLWTVNSLLSSTSEHPNPKSIGKSRIFPVRYPDGTVTRSSEGTDFCIVDREVLYQTFKTRIKFLNFTLKEVAELRPFIEWIGLESRYLSRNVKNVTSFPGGSTEQILDPKRQIKYRAHALLRIAAHYNSPRLQNQHGLRSFYEILRNSEVLETDSISSNLVVYQDGEPFEVKGEDATLHIEETQERLKIYLPKDADDQQYVFSANLAGKLFSQMITDPRTNIPGHISNSGINATKDILLTPRSKLARALEDCGIAPIDVENVDEDDPPEATVTSMPIRSREASSQVLLRTSRDESQSSTFPTPASTEAGIYWDDEDDDYENDYYLSSTARSNFRSSGPSPSPALFHRPVSPGSIETNTRHYGALLQRVVEAARASSIPHFQSSSHDIVPSARDTSDWGLRSLSQIERDCKVGAAGELYVFELLSHISTSRPLPGFSRDNWQSTIRKFARVHPEYTNMEPWNGRETSDITYTDSEGILTEHLIEKGYLAQETWADKRPKYFIEVKTTTINMETQFFMSKAQYQRMRDNILDEENRHTIYVIFRVYNLGSDDMGLKIYLDPATLSDTGALQFTAENWSAVPGRNI